MATSPLVPDISPFLQSLQQFTPQARQNRQFQLAGLEQQQALGAEQLQQAQTENKRAQIISLAEQNRADLLGDKSDLTFVMKNGAEGLRNRLALLAQEKDPGSVDLDEIVKISNIVATDPQRGFQILNLELDKTNRGLDLINQIAGRASGQAFTLSEGQVRFGPGGQPIAAVPSRKEGETKQVQVNKLRSTLNNNLKDFRKVGDAFNRILSVTKKPSAAGDLALIFNFMKILDPGSVVRESEFRTAEQARAWLSKADDTNITVPTAVRTAINKAITGQRLLPDQRADFVQQSRNLFESQRQSADVLVGNILQQADQDEIDRVKILGKQRLKDFELRQPGAFTPVPADPIKEPEGTIARSKDGREIVVRNGTWVLQ